MSHRAPLRPAPRAKARLQRPPTRRGRRQGYAPCRSLTSPTGSSSSRGARRLAENYGRDMEASMANQQEPDRSQTPGQTEGGGRERGIERREGTSAPVRRGQQSAAPGPFSLMRKFSEDMDRFFGDFFGPS